MSGPVEKSVCDCHGMIYLDCPNIKASLHRGAVQRWYFGWNIVAAATLLTLLTAGMRLGIGPFFLPMSRDLGFSRSLLSSIIGVGVLCYGLAMALAGYLVGRLGTRFVLLLGTAFVIVSTIWTVVARTPLSFMLAFGVLLSVGLGFASPVALTPIISRWFTRQRGMALFFLSTGSMAGIALMTPVLTLSIHWLRWQTTLVGYAIVFAVVTIPSALFIMRDDAPPNADLLPEQISAQNAATTKIRQSLRFSAAVRTAPFLKIALGLFACGFSMNLLGAHGVPMLMDHGFDAMTSSLGIGIIGLRRHSRYADTRAIVGSHASQEYSCRHLLRPRSGLLRAASGRHPWAVVYRDCRRRHGLGRQHRDFVRSARRHLRRPLGRCPVRHRLSRASGSWNDQYMARRLGLRAIRYPLGCFRKRRGTSPARCCGFPKPTIDWIYINGANHGIGAMTHCSFKSNQLLRGGES